MDFLKCKRCGHEWLPRILHRQAKCPNCQSKQWDKEREDGASKVDSREVERTGEL